MKRTSSALAAMVAAGLLLTATGRAQANRVFASARSGSDTNACNDITTPCQTLQGAVNQVAAGGAVLVLDGGAYGPLNITKAVVIEAPIGIDAFIHPPSGPGIQINAGASDVIVLRGLTVVGGPSSQGSDGFGIGVITGGSVYVERCRVQDFASGIGGALFNSVSDLSVEDTAVEGFGFAGIQMSGPFRGTVDGCLVAGPGEFGIFVAEGARAAVARTAAAGAQLGVSCTTSTGVAAALVLEKCLVAGNAVAGVQEDGFMGQTATLWLSNSTVTGNGGPSAPNWAGIRQLDGGQFLTRTNNTVEGNFLDEYGMIGSYSPK